MSKEGLVGADVEAVDALTGRRRTFRLSELHLPPQLTIDLATGFSVATSSHAGTMKSLATAKAAFRSLQAFAKLLHDNRRKPPHGLELRVSDLQLARLSLTPHEFDSLRSVLRRNLSAWPGDVQRELFTAAKKRDQAPVESYARVDMLRILEAAREDVRVARERIRPNIALLKRWRSGHFDADRDSREYRRGEVLDQVARTADIPRWQSTRTEKSGQPISWLLEKAGFRHGTEALHSMLLTQHEITAFMVLMIGLTGQNVGTLNRLSAVSHQATNPERDPVATVIVETIKPRRGAHNAHQDVPLADIPPWLRHGAGRSERDLRTPYGVFALLLELGEPAREAGRSKSLFAWYARGAGNGLRNGTETRSIRNGISEKSTATDWTKNTPSSGRRDYR